MATRQELFANWNKINTARSEVLDVLESMKKTDRQSFQESVLWDVLDSFTKEVDRIKASIDLLNVEHADGAATIPVADECAQQDLREAEQIVSDEINDYEREKGRM